ncbi:hypothetical protein [Spiroplasma endosymbiont of Labia minor]|uniref:hypothetical protein n=1 Tax=Spiroplasma endosymbiont of Labia minor TaxID=3066305 RepID=UPI0030D4A84F
MAENKNTDLIKKAKANSEKILTEASKENIHGQVYEFKFDKSGNVIDENGSIRFTKEEWDALEDTDAE